MRAIMKVVLLGPPGAGKGTQAARLAEALDIPKISSGDLFRDHQRRDTELGRLARSYMERGVLVPDKVTIKMVMEWIDSTAEAGGFLLDGFPRTLAQAKALDQAMADKGGVDRVLYVTVSQEELVSRLGGRLLCRSCQAPYNLRFSPPKAEGKCDLCGEELYQRDDDKPEAVRKRIEVYSDETEPLVEYYRRADKLAEVDGEGPIDEVGQALLAEVGCIAGSGTSGDRSATSQIGGNGGFSGEGV